LRSQLDTIRAHGLIGEPNSAWRPCGAVLPAPNVRAPKALKRVVSAIRRNELYVLTHVRPESGVWSWNTSSGRSEPSHRLANGTPAMFVFWRMSSLCALQNLNATGALRTWPDSALGRLSSD